MPRRIDGFKRCRYGHCDALIKSFLKVTESLPLHTYLDEIFKFTGSGDAKFDFEMTEKHD